MIGLFIPIVILILATIVNAVLLAGSYDGKCGGYLPWLAGPKPCTLFEFVTSNLVLVGVIMWSSYWPIVVVLLFMPAAVGYLLDKRKAHH
jgi:phosphatidylglycerophosphate synthase